MSSNDYLDTRMAHLGRLLKDEGTDYDRGYHHALADTLTWMQRDGALTEEGAGDQLAGNLLHLIEVYLDSPDNWPTPEDEHPLETLHRRLAHWEETQCDDPDRTVTAWRYMGILSAALALAEQGVHLPDRWIADQIDAVRELIGDERCDGCAELFVPGELIPCESCGGAFCPSCESKPCPKAVQA